MRKFRFALLTVALVVAGPSTHVNAAIILLQDNFDTSGSINDSLGSRQAGSTIGLTGYASESFLTLGTNVISGNQLLLNDGSGGSAQVSILHDFVDPLILLEEGFRMTLEVDPDITSATTTANYFGLALGQRAATAGSGFPETDSSSDFGIRLAGNGAFFVTRGGTALGTYDASPATNKVYQLDLAVATTSFAAGNTATITLLMDSVAVDLNGVAAGTDLTITWDSDGENYISLIGGGSGSLVDNLQVTPIPEPAAGSAMLAGLLCLMTVYRRRR